MAQISLSPGNWLVPFIGTVAVRVDSQPWFTLANVDVYAVTANLQSYAKNAGGSNQAFAPPATVQFTPSTTALPTCYILVVRQAFSIDSTLFGQAAATPAPGSGTYAEIPFTSTLQFGATHEQYMMANMSADIAFTLASAGNVNNNTIRVAINPDNTHAVTLSSDFQCLGSLSYGTNEVLFLDFTYFALPLQSVCMVTKVARAGAAVAPTPPTLAAPASAVLVSNSANTATATSATVTGATTYVFQLATTAAFATITATGSASTATYLFSGLAAGTYYTRAKAQAAGYNDSAFSAASAAVTVAAAAAPAPGQLPPPATLQVVASTNGTNQADWTPVNQAGVAYQLFRDGVSIYLGPATEFFDTTNTTVTHTYGVAAYLSGYTTSNQTTAVSRQAAIYNLQGAAQTLTLANADAGLTFPAGTGFSMGGFFLLNSADPTSRIIISRSSFDTSVRAWDLVYNASNLSLRYGDAAGNSITWLFGTYPIYFIMVHSGGTDDAAVKMYVRGNIYPADRIIRTGTFTTLVDGGVVTLGQVAGAASINSRVDDLFFAPPLVQAEIDQVFAGTGGYHANPLLLGFASKVIAYYDFNGNTDDATGRHNGSATSPLYV